MKIVLLCFALLAAYIGYEWFRVGNLIKIGVALSAQARSFNREEGVRHVLVVGDSTAVGVGASPEGSVPGRLSRELDASIENHAVSGAQTADIASQFQKARRERYDLVLIQVGANDIIRGNSLKKAAENANLFLADAAKLSDRIVLLTAGKIGEAPFFPRVAAPLVTWRAGLLRERFIAVAAKHDVLYVDLFEKAEQFAKSDYASDSLHLSDSGYAKWFNVIKNDVRARWPEPFTREE